MLRAGSVLLVLLGGCFLFYPSYEPVYPPTAPTPIKGLNTPWDDYNAAKRPGLGQLVYSTNRGSQGGDLDVWIAYVQWGQQPRAIGEPRPYEPELMSLTDERGPLQLSTADFMASEGASSREALAFTSARDGGAGGLDLYWAQIGPPIVHRLEHLSSAANDAYLTTKFGDVIHPHVLFASDRGGAGYDIYEAAWDSYQIGGPPLYVRKVGALSSIADDNAPFVARQRDYVSADVVFASKRAGGLGGWDIWCSHYDGKTYASPVPIAIANTKYDEFRPSIADGNPQFLVFSSNRPGGVGGYDLYTVKFEGCGR